MCNGVSLKATLRHMVARVGTSRRAAELAGVPCSDMSLWTSDASPRFIPVDHLMDLDAAAGDLFLKEWARIRGYELIPLAHWQSTAPTLIKTIGEFSKAAGELECTTLKAAEDGRITPSERRHIQDCIAPCEDLLAQTMATIS
jgi:hypothetical protein